MCAYLFLNYVTKYFKHHSYNNCETPVINLVILGSDYEWAQYSTTPNL